MEVQMAYLLTFLEGILAFLSPCVLPLLPIYAAYFAAGESDGRRMRKNALGFSLGLVVTFVSMGAIVNLIGARIPARPIEIVAGSLLLLFGLHYVGLLRIPALSRNHGKALSAERLRSLSFPWAVLFGAVFALCWTPCVGPLLGAALMKAALASTVIEGAILLFLFALGLGLPFLLSALLLDQLKGAFAAIKRHYVTINRICGILLIAMGVLMILGMFGQLMHRLI